MADLAQHVEGCFVGAAIVPANPSMEFIARYAGLPPDQRAVLVIV
ncbi:hypothetical protein [Mesorhizobium captivum]|nr:MULTISPECIES: hypothetical protein [unclassified Mesorhizobium]MDX8449169.1 hypothetical protein [Mesorhizobium sp. VK3C]MDX8514658.1 hypothetical protein [Mesorhizobium sp. VK23E]